MPRVQSGRPSLARPVSEGSPAPPDSPPLSPSVSVLRDHPSGDQFLQPPCPSHPGGEACVCLVSCHCRLGSEPGLPNLGCPPHCPRFVLLVGRSLHGGGASLARCPPTVAACFLLRAQLLPPTPCAVWPEAPAVPTLCRGKLHCPPTPSTAPALDRACPQGTQVAPREGSVLGLRAAGVYIKILSGASCLRFLRPSLSPGFPRAGRTSGRRKASRWAVCSGTRLARGPSVRTPEAAQVVLWPVWFSCGVRFQWAHSPLFVRPTHRSVVASDHAQLVFLCKHVFGAVRRPTGVQAASVCKPSAKRLQLFHFLTT